MGSSWSAVGQTVGTVWPYLDERQRRLMAGAAASAVGRGGVTALAEATGLSRTTVRRGVAELAAGEDPGPGRIRRAGGGRRSTVDKDPQVLAALDALVDPDSRGDPESPLRWTCKSTRRLAQELTVVGHPVSRTRVGELLGRLGYSLQATVKTREGAQHADRDAQFRHINDTVRRFGRARNPVVSVDTKKKELVGDDPGYANGGREWQPAKSPVPVGVHDFPDPDVPKAVPYGIYDLAANAGWVSVGCDGDTAEFAVATLRRWWTVVGRPTYPRAKKLLICADAGGSNGYRIRLWKSELAKLATDTGLTITVCHFPPGTSKWNRIEHRLFSHISINWRGRPLTSHQVVVDLIGATTTRTGLRVHAEADTNPYPRGIKISDKQYDAVLAQVHKHDFHGEWNYDIRPAKTKTTAV